MFGEILITKGRCKYVIEEQRAESIFGKLPTGNTRNQSKEMEIAKFESWECLYQKICVFCSLIHYFISILVICDLLLKRQV